MQANAQGTWSTLTNVAPHSNGGVMVLMTDGTVLCKTEAGGTGQGTLWDKLTPDSHGSYLNGTWTTTAAMANDRLYFSSQVLRDGRLYVAGGEYGAGGSSAEIYNPLTDTWSAAATSSGTPFLSDANSQYLPNFTILQAIQSGTTTGNYIYNPTTNSVSTAPSSAVAHDEVAWLKLPDSSILQADLFGQTAERYIPSTNTWISDASVPVQLYDAFGFEAGGALLLPNGKAFFLGATGHTAIYTPSGSTANGSWVAGPDLPSVSGVATGTPDAPCAMMVDGKVLIVASPLPRSSNHFPDSTYYFEYDYTTNTFSQRSTPIGGTMLSGFGGSYTSNMLALPDGNILYSIQGISPNYYFLYTPGGSAIAGGQPTVSNIFRLNCDTFMAVGHKFNGISEGACYGDDWQMASNYPMIRLTNGTSVYYTRVYNWNSSGVARGSANDTAYFILPASLPTATYNLQVVANGNPSANWSFNPSLAISPTSAAVCVGSSTTLTDPWTGGTWSSGSTSVANVGSSTGVVTGAAAGTTNITYTFSAGCTSSVPVTVNASPTPITGTMGICVGGNTTLASTPSGGTWSSASPGVASVNSSTGAVTGIANGTAVISYTVSGCFVTATVTVSATASGITGTPVVCVGATTPLSDATTGGTWSSSNSSIASVNSTSGLVTGVAAGNATISYSTGSGCVATQPVTVNANPSAISGASSVCISGTATLSSSPSGGTWTSGSPGIASVGSSSGIVSGVSAGTATIVYTLGTGCFVSRPETVNAAPAAITGTPTVCVGATTPLSDATPGGTWSSSNSSIASVNSRSGLVSGVAAGNATISYSTGSGCVATQPVTVNANPSAISGTSTVCLGGSATLISSPSGGTWTSDNTVVASVGSTSGIVNGNTLGTANISYTLSNGCFISQPVSVSTAPSAISGTLNVCSGATTALSDAVGGGVWISSNSSIATVGSTSGVATGVAPGTSTISYSLGAGCSVSAILTVNSSPGAISGTASVCASLTTTLSATPPGGTWSSSDITIATVGSSNGIVTGMGIGTAGITYTMPGGCFSATTVTVSSSAGAIAGTAGACVGSTTTLSDASGGGVWSTSAPTIATVGASNGIVAGVSPGFATITYSIGSGCSASVVVTVHPVPAIVSVIGGGGYCPGGSGVNVGISGSAIGIDYQLYLGGVAVGGAMAGIGSTLYFGRQTTAGTYTVVATDPVTLCSSNMSGSANVVIYSLPNAYAVTGGGGYCTGGSGVNVGLSTSDIGISYQLYRGGVAILGAVLSGSGAALNFGSQTTAGVYTIVATNPGTTCTNIMAGSAIVSINALPTLYSVTGGGSYCSGGTGVSIGLGSSDAGVNYQLYRGTTAVGTAVAGTGSSISFGAQTVAGTYTVIATDATTGCTATMTGSASVSIASLPTVFSMTGGGSFCAGGSGVSVGLSASTFGVRYQLYLGGAPVGSLVAGTGSALSFGLQTVAGTYTASALNSTTGCTSNMSGSATVSINPSPTVFTVTGGGGYCSGGTGLHIGLSGSQSGVNYQLMRGTTGVGSAVAGTGVALDFGLQTTAGTYTVVATSATTGCNISMSGSASISVNPLPSIYTMTGGGNYCPGGSGVHVGLNNSTVGINYQLYLGASAVGSAVAGTGAAIDFGLQTTAGIYTAKATDATTGCASNMSGSATVSISALPGVFTVTGGGGYCSGGTGVSVGLSGSAIGNTYQLYRGGVAVGSALAGTGSTLNFGLQTVAGTYTVVATGTSTGCTNNMTGSATVTVNPLPTVFSMTGTGSYCAGGTGLPIGLSGSQTGVNYQLYRGGVASGAPVAGTGAAISFGLQTVTSTYTATAVNASTGCTSNMSGTATISINPLPSLVTVTGGGSYCAGGSGVHVGLYTSFAGTNYQLYLGGSAVGGPVAGTGASIDFGLQTGVGTYTVIATNATTLCTNTMSGSVTVSTNPLPTVYSVTGGGTLCAGSTGVAVGLSGSNTGIKYQLYLGSVAVGTIVYGTGAAISFGLQTVAGTYTVVASNSTTACTATMSGSATVTVNAAPTPYTVTGGGGYCTGGSGVHVGLSSSDAGINYQLYRGTTAVGTPVAGTGVSLDFGIMTIAGTYTVKATNSSTGCTGNMSGSATVTINALPNVFAMTGGGSYCPGGAGVHVGLSNSTTGVNYQLYVGGSPVGSPVAGIGAALDFGLQTTAGTYTAVATNAATGCTANMSGSVTVAINSAPTAFTVTGGGTYCAGGAGFHVGLSSSVTGVSYQLYRGSAAVGTAMAGTGSALDFGVQTVAGTYTVIATATGTGCTATMSGSALIIVNPLPTSYTVTGGGVYCTGGSGVHVGLSNSAVGVNYQLMLGSSTIGSAVAGTGAALDFGLETTSGTYTVVATNATTGCTSTMSGSAVVTAASTPTAFTVTGGGSYCPGGTGVNIGLSGSQLGVSYQLYLGGSAFGASVAGTGSAISFGPLTIVGSYTAVATVTGSTCTASMTGSATVSLSTPPVIDTVTGGGSTCSAGPGVHIGLNTSSSGVNYQLYRGSTPVGSALAGTGSALDFGIFLTGGTYTVVATNSTSCSATMYGNAVVTVGSSPAIVSMTGGGGYCTGGSGVHVGLAASAVGVNYQLYLGGSPVGSPVAGIGAALDFGPQTAGGTYTATATYAGTSCSSNMSGSATVTAYSLPAVDTVTGGGSYCTGGTGVLIGLNTSTSTVSYKLQMSGVTYATMTGTGASLNFGLYTAAGTYTVLAVAGGTGCTNSMYGSASVSINPNPTVSGSIYTVAPAATITLTGSISGGTWTSSNSSIASINASTGVITGVALGTCTMTYTLPTGCWGVHTVSVTPTGFRGNSITATTGESVLSVVPNPNHGTFTIKGALSTTDDQEVSLEVTNMLGQVVYSNKVTALHGIVDQTVQLNGSFANGMYLLNVRTDNERKQFHIVVEQ